MLEDLKLGCGLMIGLYTIYTHFNTLFASFFGEKKFKEKKIREKKTKEKKTKEKKN